MARQIMLCKESTIVDIDGVPTPIYKGRTRAHSDHALVKNYPEAWEPISVDYATTEDTSSRTRDTGRTNARAVKKTAAKKVAEVKESVTPPAKKVAEPKPSGLTTKDLERPADGKVK